VYSKRIPVSAEAHAGREDLRAESPASQDLRMTVSYHSGSPRLLQPLARRVEKVKRPLSMNAGRSVGVGMSELAEPKGNSAPETELKL
jgi:hypothetical protein